MLVNSSVEIDIREIIERKGIDIHFQPIISLRKQRRVGVEALARAAGPGGTIVSPAVLFGRAAADGLTVELDRLCWRTALERFAPLHTADPQVILFINFDPASLIAGAIGPDGLIEQVERLGIDPRNVAIEILETAFGDADRMRESITRFKRSGFLVVLDDVGIGQSNFDRILFVRPDILKTDRSLTHDLSREYMKREIFRAIVKLSEKIGGWTITEGIETEEDALVALDLGGDMLQGFLFGRPAPLQSGDSFGDATPPMQSVAAKFRDYTMKKVTTARSQRERRIRMVRSLGRQLGELRREEWEGVLAEALRCNSDIESACILDGSGRQLTETLWRSDQGLPEKEIIFRPPESGADHSLKEYFYLLQDARIDPVETQPYVPLPTGKLCVTLSTRFEDASSHSSIVCLHMSVTDAAA